MLTLDTMLKHIKVKGNKDKAIKVKDIMVRKVEIIKRRIQFGLIVDSQVI